MKLRYAVVFEQTPNNYCAYAPDVPGCVSTGTTWKEIQDNIPGGTGVPYRGNGGEWRDTP